MIDWLVCCLLVALDLWKRMSLKCSITMIFTCPLLSWCKIPSAFRENNDVLVFSIPFHIFMLLVNLWLIRLQGQLPILRTRSYPALYLLTHPPKRPFELGRERILIPGFVRSPMLAVYDVAHSLLQGGIGRGFPFTEN